MAGVCRRLHIQCIALYNWPLTIVTVRLLYPTVLHRYFIICHNVKHFLLFNTYKMLHEICHLSGDFSSLPSWHSRSPLKFHHSFHILSIVPKMLLPFAFKKSVLNWTQVCQFHWKTQSHKEFIFSLLGMLKVASKMDKHVFTVIDYRGCYWKCITIWNAI